MSSCKESRQGEYEGWIGRDHGDTKKAAVHGTIYLFPFASFSAMEGKRTSLGNVRARGPRPPSGLGLPIQHHPQRDRDPR